MTPITPVRVPFFLSALVYRERFEDYFKLYFLFFSSCVVVLFLLFLFCFVFTFEEDNVFVVNTRAIWKVRSMVHCDCNMENIRPYDSTFWLIITENSS